MNRKVPYLFFASSLAIMAGCGDDNVKYVKNSQGLNEKYTNEQLLDHRKVCGNTKWKSTKDERGREMVEYTCSFSPINSEIASAITQANQAGLSKYKEKLAGRYLGAISDANYQIKSDSTYEDPTNEYHQRYLAAKEKLAKLEGIKEDYNAEVEKFTSEIQKDIDKLNATNPERQQVISFAVVNKEIQSVEMDFLIDGKSLVKRVAMRPLEIFKAEVASPDSLKIYEKWIERWAIEGEFFVSDGITDRLEKFPYKCNNGVCVKT